MFAELKVLAWGGPAQGSRYLGWAHLSTLLVLLQVGGAGEVAGLGRRFSGNLVGHPQGIKRNCDAQRGPKGMCTRFVAISVSDLPGNIESLTLKQAAGTDHLTTCKEQFRTGTMGQFGFPSKQVYSRGSTDPPHSWGLNGKQRIWKRLRGGHGVEVLQRWDWNPDFSIQRG